ncbi:hypothetical protein POPTR_015G106101v4 [Populus trichocarpa]|uniref:Uncharacterized protein n=1 Tax=Populus trichocarpa TaxID=3694 RepID=A0ACC0RVZ8_POPTR|nr:hypothetical protein POPTR_015G106101v4 [Populus trichocarpa]
MFHICDWEIGRPLQIDRVEVHKRPKPYLTYGMGLLEETVAEPYPQRKNDTLEVQVAECREDDEVIEVR